MVTPRGRRELERTASWVAVRRGLGWLIGIWVVLTVGSVGAQVLSLRLAPLVAAQDPGALALTAMASGGYQVFYTLSALALAGALLRLTRVPPATRAVTPALVATSCFVLVTVLSFALLFGVTGSSSESLSTRELWVLVATARAGGLLALVLALSRVAAAAGARAPQALVGAGFAFVAIDSGFPLYRLLAGVTDPQPPSLRVALIVVQVLLAVALVDLAWRVRRVSAELARRELAARPPGRAERRSAAPAASHPERAHVAGEPAAAAPADALPAAAPARPMSGGTRALAALLLLVLVVLVPAWDALDASRSVGALTDAVRGVAGTEPPTTLLLFAVGGVGAALLLWRLLPSSPYGARGVFLLAVLAAVGHAAPRTYEVARFRSHQVDAWPVCETGLDVEGNLPSVENVYRGPYDGSRLATGEPCVLAAERRDQHAQTAPHGDFSDGIVQIATRFPEDRRRVLWGSLAWILLAAVCGALVWKAADAARTGASGTRTTPRAREDAGVEGGSGSGSGTPAEPGARDENGAADAARTGASGTRTDPGTGDDDRGDDGREGPAR